MALQSSGQISIKDIFREVTKDEWGNMVDPVPNLSVAQLYGLESLINPNSLYKPGISATFARISEWYGYNHHTVIERGINIVITNNTTSGLNCGIYGSFESSYISESGSVASASSISLYSSSSVPYGHASLTFEVESMDFPSTPVTDMATLIVYYLGTNKAPLEVITYTDWSTSVVPSTLSFRLALWTLTDTVTIEIILGPLNNYY